MSSLKIMLSLFQNIIFLLFFLFLHQANKTLMSYSYFLMLLFKLFEFTFILVFFASFESLFIRISSNFCVFWKLFSSKSLILFSSSFIFNSYGFISLISFFEFKSLCILFLLFNLSSLITMLYAFVIELFKLFKLLLLSLIV